MIIVKLKRAGRSLLDLVFPVLCVECGLEGSYLCNRCRAMLKRNEFQICQACGHKSPFGITHPACRTPDGLDGLITTTPYKEKLSRRLVELMKYNYISDIAPILGSMIAEEVRNQEMVGYFRDFTLIPLPLHKSREKWRGYNQAELIARQIATDLNLRIRPDILYRLKKTKVQAELKDDERAANVRGAFSTLGSVSEKFIIVDDVSTTRSTLQQACLALKKSGADEIWAVAFAQG